MEDKEYKFNFGEEDLTKKDNTISTTKYTRYNFICKNLFEQFHRMSNVYFLVSF